MTQKDFIKLLLCMHGYDRSINIEISNLGVNGTLYDIQAENTDRTDDLSIYENGFYFTVYELLEYFKTKNLKSFYFDVPLKSIFNDKEREEILDYNIKEQQKLNKYLKKMESIDKFISDHNICINCKINKKDHWDDIHYNCEICHNNTCKYMVDFFKLAYDLRKTNNDEDKINEINEIKNKIVEIYNITSK